MDFNPELNEDQLQIQQWVHDFAAEVVRPAAADWDEREETPWPIIKEAAEIGLYSWEFMAEAMMNDPTGLTMPVALEELFWGDAGIGLSIMGSGLAAAGIAASGTPEQVMEWVPQCYGSAENLMLGAFAASEPDAGSDVAAIRTRAVYEESTDEWVINGTKTWITNGGIADVHVVVAVVDPELGSRGHASFVIPPGNPGLSQGQKFLKHGIRASHTAEGVLTGTAYWVVKTNLKNASRAFEKANQGMRKPPCRPLSPPVQRWVLKRLGSPAQHMNTHSSTRKSDANSVARLFRINQSRSCWQIWRWR